MEYTNILLTFPEFCDYLRIKPTLGKKLISDPKCRYILRIGRKVLIYKKALDLEIEKCAKNQTNLLKE